MSDRRPTQPRPRPVLDNPRHQPMGHMPSPDVDSGFHMDLRGVAGSYGPPDEAGAWLELLAVRRERVLPVTVLQLGLGAWQRGKDRNDPDAVAWARIAKAVGNWAAIDMDGHGRFTHYQPMPHTYAIDGGWHSAMAQGLGASLLVRTGDPASAARAAESLLDPAFGLVSQTEHGPVLEEYPSDPPAHVLNGWIWALLGLCDLSHTTVGCPELARSRAAIEFVRGVDSLVAQLPEYELRSGWSTYDRFPHAISNIASPFYHRLHVDMLRALDRAAPRVELAATADRWESALARPITRATAVARKVGFRLVKPRGRKAA